MVKKTNNEKTPSAKTPVKAYADALDAIFKAEIKLRLKDGESNDAPITQDFYAQLGQELAKAQVPPRAIPYHDFTIKGWAKGELLPTPQAQAALLEVLEKEYGTPQNLLDALEKTHDAAIEWQAEQKNQPTELSHALKYAVEVSGRSQAEITREFVNRNEAWKKTRKIHENFNGKNPLPQTGPGVSNILNGENKHSPPKFFTYAIEQRCKPFFSLRAIHENSLRERADQLWVTAERENDLGGLIKACRVRLGESRDTFATRIGIMVKKEGFGTGPTCGSWETNQSLPTGKNHETGQTLYEPLVQAMKLADTAKNGLSLSIPAPWFDEAKEKTFRKAFTFRVQEANQRLFSDIAIPDLKPVKCPDPKGIDLRLKRYDGKLLEFLVTGREQKK